MGSKPLANTTKKPAAPPPAPLTTAEIDELIELNQKLDPELGRLKPDVDRREALNKRLRAQYADESGTQRFTVPGTSFDLLVGPKRNESVADKKGIYKFFGVREFVEILAQVTKTAVVEALKRRGKPESGADAFFKLEPIGWRPIDVIAKAPVPPAAQKKAA